MPSVFLSRHLQENSPFRILEQGVAWTVSAYSLLRLEPLPLVSTPPVDWFFFYSQNGVRFFLSQYQPAAPTRLAAIGPATAAALTEAGFAPHFIGNGQPEEVAKAFKRHATDQCVGFVQAQQSRRSVQHILKNTVQSSNWVVYDNQPNTELAANIPPTDYLIFTSPLNVAAWQPEQQRFAKSRFIAIGTTTADALRAAGIKNYREAAAPSEKALLKCLLSWEQDSPVST